MRTKQEVINWLNSKVGTKVPCKGNGAFDGQCTTLIKALMEYLGAPNPYLARGDANSCISAYLGQGLADRGIGFISAFSSKTMAGGTGHIWVNVGDGAGEYFESNGAKALTVTKGGCNYKYDNVCNFDRYVSDLNSSQSSGNQDSNSNERINMTGIELANLFLQKIGKGGNDADWSKYSEDQVLALANEWNARGETASQLDITKAQLATCKMDLSALTGSNQPDSSSAITQTKNFAGKVMSLKRVRIDTATSNQVAEYE